MSQERLVKFECGDCHMIGYYSQKNKRKLSAHRLQLNKFCKRCGTHTVHKETK